VKEPAKRSVTTYYAFHLCPDVNSFQEYLLKKIMWQRPNKNCSAKINI